MKEIILLHAIRLSESINFSVIHLIKSHLCLLQMSSGVVCDTVRINLSDLTRDARPLKRYVFSYFVQSKPILFSAFDPATFLSFLCVKLSVLVSSTGC